MLPNTWSYQMTDLPLRPALELVLEVLAQLPDCTRAPCESRNRDRNQGLAVLPTTWSYQTPQLGQTDQVLLSAEAENPSAARYYGAV